MADPLLQVGQALSLLSTLVGVVIFALAVQGYRRNRSPSMLALGTGIATLTLVNILGNLLAARLYGVSAVPVVNGVTQLAGMCLLLYAIVLARRE